MSVASLSFANQLHRAPVRCHRWPAAARVLLIGVAISCVGTACAITPATGPTTAGSNPTAVTAGQAEVLPPRVDSPAAPTATAGRAVVGDDPTATVRSAADVTMTPAPSLSVGTPTASQQRITSPTPADSATPAAPTPIRPTEVRLSPTARAAAQSPVATVAVRAQPPAPTSTVEPIAAPPSPTTVSKPAPPPISSIVVDITEPNGQAPQAWSFQPASLTVKIGTTVKWINLGGVPHTVTADGGKVDSGLMQPKGSFSFVLSTAGTFTYTCAYHPWMKGAIIVTS